MMKSGDHSTTAAAAPPQSQSNYASSLTRIAVAQICGTVGYAAAESSALAVLTDITGLYLKAIAKSAASSANSRGRTDSNLLDVIAALDELGSVQGFHGASRTTTTALMSSSSVGELERFVRYAEETPFAKPLPPRNAPLRRNTKQSKRGGVHEYNEGRFRHVPKWLPAIPEIAEEGKAEEKSEGVNSSRLEREEGKCDELPAKRMKVRFKLSKEKWRRDLEGKRRSGEGGVCRGGIGKRVSCENFGEDESKEEESLGVGKSVIRQNKFKLVGPVNLLLS